MLLIGDKIKQVKAIEGFNFVGKEFIIEDIKGTNIVFSKLGLGKGVMTIGEFEEHFEKIVEPTWSEWIDLGLTKKYRVKGDLIEMRLLSGGSSVFSKPCEEDEFNLETGLQVCNLKLNIKECEKTVEAIKKEANKKIVEIQNTIKRIRARIENI